MSLYYAAEIQQVRDLDDAVYAAWQAAANPKAAFWKAIPQPPDPRATYNGTAWVMPPLDEIKSQCISRINWECTQRLVSRFGPPERQVSISLGIYGTAERELMTASIAAHVDASNDASDRVLQATTVAQAESVTVNWPEIPA